MEMISNNASMTAIVARACKEAGARLVYASSDEVYGDGDSREILIPPALPGSIYGLSKFWGENAGRLYAPEGFTALRFSMLYGPGLQPGRSEVVDCLLRARRGRQMLVDAGERSWCWIGDAVRAARLAIEKGEGAYNIGRGDDAVTTMHVAELACILAGNPSNISLPSALRALAGFPLSLSMTEWR